MGAITGRASIALAAAVLATVGLANPAGATPSEPRMIEAPVPARRVAERALQRGKSTEWPVDVSARLRLLEEHAERAARERDTSGSIGSERMSR